MDEYLIPTKEAEAEFTEKRSRFIGHIWPVETEEEALECLKIMREKHWDAGHNVYAYIIKDGPTRFSDAGEPFDHLNKEKSYAPDDIGPLRAVPEAG